METRKILTILVMALDVVLGPAMFARAGDPSPPTPQNSPSGKVMEALDEVEPRIPIHASDLPMTITEPNSYYLVEDVNFTDDANNAITIECNNVTIDLMGYTLKGPDSGDKSGVYIDGQTNVEIRNGTIRDFGSYAIANVGGVISGGHRVLNIRALSNLEGGIFLYGYGILIKDCTALENSSDGISCLGGSGNTVTGNMCSNNGGLGIVITGPSTATGNTCFYNRFAGITAERSTTVTGNTCGYNRWNGIDTSYGCTVTGNTCCYNDHIGIDASYGCTVTGNTCCYNDNIGISAFSGCMVTGNTCYNNDFDGINADENTTVTGNTVNFNDRDGIDIGHDCKVIDNTCSHNGSSIDDDGAGIHATGSGNHIERNNVVGNDRGIDVDAADNLIVKNSASKNDTEYNIIAGNKVGTITTDPTTAGPWDNFDF